MPLLGAFPVLDTKGAVALAERGLMLHAVEFMLIVAVPVLFLTFFFAWRYRAQNTKAAYTPNWEHSKMEELVWWAIPFEIVLILGALTWSSTHELHPPRPLSTEPPLVVQVVALEWKWLFIYPQEGIATVNFLEIPVGRPVRFEVTADAPMNSFWVPALGGQIYAMTGMVKTINLVADEEGTFAGLSANYSGEGFAQMRFVVHAVAPQEFDSWVADGPASSTPVLRMQEYAALALPGPGTAQLYALPDKDLYSHIVSKYTDGGSMPHIH